MPFSLSWLPVSTPTVFIAVLTHTDSSLTGFYLCSALDLWYLNKHEDISLMQTTKHSCSTAKCCKCEEMSVVYTTLLKHSCVKAAVQNSINTRRAKGEEHRAQLPFTCTFHLHQPLLKGSCTCQPFMCVSNPWSILHCWGQIFNIAVVVAKWLILWQWWYFTIWEVAYDYTKDMF